MMSLVAAAICASTPATNSTTAPRVIVMACLADLTLAPAIVSLALRGRPRDTDEALRS